MKRFWKQFAWAAVLGLGLPAAAVAWAAGGQEEPAETPETAETWEAPQQQITVFRDGQRQQMTMTDYLTGVVLAEMPTDFAEEALKAQAVVARTYALRRMESGGKHDGAVCTLPECCQGFSDPEAFSSEQVDKVRRAVESTDELVLTYDGALIDATYFSCSGGWTEDAVAVWGADVPYLQAVESPGEERAVHDREQVCFTGEAFAGMLERNLPGSPTDWFGPVTHTRGGGVDTMEICGQAYRGTELRSILGLRSTDFTVSVAGDTITIETRGFGHRVGMSQYGADAMAAGGSTCAEILAHYYQGTSLTAWSPEQ